MTLREHVPLSSLTTFRIGGVATLVAECDSTEDIKTAITVAVDRGLAWYVLGGGSNMLAPDDGFDGMIILMREHSIEYQEKEDIVHARVAAGVSWDAFVKEVAERELWGVENLAGIPGTVGASPVQNIGAYGAEVSQTIVSVEVLDTYDLSMQTFESDACAFTYRDSIFKRDTSLIITAVTFALTREPSPNIAYADILARKESGASLETPTEIGDVVRDIRAKKFPDLSKEGTAGSFFKNPTITKDKYEVLTEKYPGLPGYETAKGIKVSLAWILDKTLKLRGFTKGPVRLYEQQPLVLVASNGATAADVDSLAADVTEKVFTATGITIEREVRSLI